MSDRSPLDELRQDHAGATEALRGLADVIAQLDERLAVPWPGIGEQVRDRAQDLRNLLVLHFRREEEALFPEVTAIISEGAPRVDILSQFLNGEADDDLTAHTLMRGRLRGLLDLLTAWETAGDLEPAQAKDLRMIVNLTGDLLRRHMEKEHKLVFPMIERLLDQAQVLRVLERMKEIREAA